VLFAVRESIHVQDYYLNVSASMGIALFPDDAREKHAILKYADSAMYAAKEKGKDNYQFYTRQLSFDMQGRLNLEQELLHAEERGELHVYYQPQYDLKSRKVVGAEALLRWKSEDLGEVPPDEFIAIAEETGMVVQIGYYVFEEACKAYVQWRKQGHDIKTIAINVSSVQFREEGFLENIRAIILRTDIAPECVEIEITERVIMEYSTSNMTTLDELRALGCQISIDDFGTGYSSMSYLKKLPIDTIKIDRSFVDELPDDPYDSEVSRAIIALSKSLRYRVVAEGIENEAQEIFLRENHCDVGQGYYFARPMDAETFLDFLDKQDGNRKI
jgi:EAL domain-containing protein (putative c-di-GMP-specific phosphodiesterase class I)